EDGGKPDTYAVLLGKHEPLPLPSNVTENLSADEAGLWAVDFWQSQAGIDYSHRNRGYGLTIATNGSFRVEGVDPGTYQLTVVAGKNSLTQEVSIPEAATRGDEPMDLGTFQLTKGGKPEAADER